MTTPPRYPPPTQSPRRTPHCSPSAPTKALTKWEHNCPRAAQGWRDQQRQRAAHAPVQDGACQEGLSP
jgi:hypothetical protein